MRLIPGLSRTAGYAAGGTLALGLLVCGCVFAALAGPALSLHTRTQALHQTLAGLSAPTKAIGVSGDWATFTGPLVQYGFGSKQYVTPAGLAAMTREMSRGFAASGVPLAPGQWAGLTTNPVRVYGAGPRAQAGAPPRLELVYRDTLTANARVTAGSYAGTAVPAGRIAVAATTQMAARFGLHPGSRLSLATVDGPVRLYVTAILAERDPGSTFWAQDLIAGTPELNTPTPYWVGGVFADPGQLAAMQAAFSGPGLLANWEFPLDVGGVNADQAQGLYNILNHAVTATPALTGPLAASAGGLAVASPLISDLSAFLSTQAAVQTVLLLLFVSLIVVGAAVIVLAARMIVLRRDGELSMLRARGGSLRQVAAVMVRAALITTVPAALIGAALAVAVVPGGTASAAPAVAALPGATASAALGWWLAAVVVAAALAGPPLIAAWRHRRPAPAANPARITTAETGRPPGPRVAWRRPVAEVAACAASVAGLIVLHDQGLPASGGADWYLTVAPVLVAIPVVLVMLRLYPLAVRGLLKLTARGTGATGFVALSRAARSSLTGVLPAFALVLALSLATCAGMVRDGIARGETAASWQATGADAQIDNGPFPVTAAAVHAIASVRGVRHATAVWNTNWATAGGQLLTVIAVDPPSYAAVTAGTPFPPFPAASLGPATGAVPGVPGGPGALPGEAPSGDALSGGAPDGGTPGSLPGGAPSPAPTVPVLASPAAAAILGSAPAELFSLNLMGPFKVRIAGTLASTPALPSGGAFVVMALQTLPGFYGRPAPNRVLVTGSGIDDAQLTAVAGKVIPGNVTTFRSTVLAALTSSPLQHGAALIIVLTIAATAAFGLLIVILGLALGSADRELTLARLTVMGHERAAGLVIAEAMPAVLAAVAAGAACALVLPRLIGSSIDLSAFTGTAVPVQFQPDATAFALPAAAIMLLALAALTAQTRTLRRHGIITMLRAQ
jgi:putative ABC transport system permease protein